MKTIDSVPVIDFSMLPDPASLRAIDHACREWGFFQIIHHGLDERLIQGLHSEMRAFFALPSETKRRFARTAEYPWGFYDRELTKNARDWKEIFDCGPETGSEQKTPWPSGLPSLRTIVQAFMRSCEGVAFELLGAISTNLGMPADHLGRAFRPAHTSFLRLNYYPVCPKPARPTGVQTPESGHLGVNHHTDAGALTLLLQDDEAGLEVHREGGWHLVEPRRDALVVNIGDVVQVWSNDRYRAALHRVRASSDRARYSAPFFFNPSDDACYAPLPTAVEADSMPRYRPIRWSEFRALRSAGDYQDLGEEIQIHHYRLSHQAARNRGESSTPEERIHGVH